MTLLGERNSVKILKIAAQKKMHTLIRSEEKFRCSLNWSENRISNLQKKILLDPDESIK